MEGVETFADLRNPRRGKDHDVLDDDGEKVFFTGVGMAVSSSTISGEWVGTLVFCFSIGSESVCFDPREAMNCLNLLYKTFVFLITFFDFLSPGV